jgi:hypothetical protein
MEVTVHDRYTPSPATPQQYVDRYGRPVAIRRLPTRLEVRCQGCGRRATVETFLDRVCDLRCSRCGTRDPVIAGRSPLSQWARRRRKGNCLAHAPKVAIKGKPPKTSRPRFRPQKAVERILDDRG